MIFSLLHASTLVETAEGLKPIEEIREGDLVLAYDEQTGEQAYKPVVQLFRNETTEWYHIRAGGEEIICTGGHPFYVLNAAAGREKVNYEGCPENAKGTWICANELRSGDELLLADGTIVAIEAVTAEKLSEPETTYNFEVADFHTYYVSDCKVLVHNSDCLAKTADGKEVYRGGNDMTLKNGEYRLDANGMVKPTHGISVSADPNAVAKFGGAYKVQTLPKGLKLIQRGQNLLHYEIVPKYAMPLSQYQSLLYQIKLVPV